MDVKNVILNFKYFLEDAWPFIAKVEKEFQYHEDLINEWCQANWELMVESIVCKDPDWSLEVYGDGADFNSPSSRVSQPEALPTHRIFCLPNEGEKVTFTLEIAPVVELVFFLNLDV